jgi:hypothetical protein
MNISWSVKTYFLVCLRAPFFPFGGLDPTFISFSVPAFYVDVGAADSYSVCPENLVFIARYSGLSLAFDLIFESLHSSMALSWTSSNG